MCICFSGIFIFDIFLHLFNLIKRLFSFFKRGIIFLELIDISLYKHRIVANQTACRHLVINKVKCKYYQNVTQFCMIRNIGHEIKWIKYTSIDICNSLIVWNTINISVYLDTNLQHTRKYLLDPWLLNTVHHLFFLCRSTKEKLSCWRPLTKCKKHFKTCFVYCQQKYVYLHLVTLKTIYNILTGSNGRSSNSDPVHSTDLHPEGQERVSIILMESTQ